MDPGATLRRARRRAGLTQRALAEATGVAQPTIARIETGNEIPRVDTLARLLEGCGERLEAVPRGGEGVDRTLIRAMLAASPADRLEIVETQGRVLEDLFTSARLVTRR